ncbi:TonB-dependent siderophore receptor [Pseudomonas gingeri]|uniref:TonB-dependent siderophore receptor n=1 Tax=Pseudomonas gingeri TaxID=117681 RepID=UPI0015A40FB9|nr:TonB-dependent receptor [Pseudomonas gingeri]NWA03090.1 TonB-dependent siderophore receptor [Pseudomonas gingeri]NWA17185.1 TonB-dependent siderophore receptor [Pseudomonas gingeri]NWA57951.1 TonB-dependent siderophore receptor [Pseudomonas gingeri]NWA98669.1 TonB-dependent siderophore receptor [Pseudomonas gingeri]NWB02511.1 TonB-dependent siderophore receptor [Pseudomonas gingeri]
MPKTHRLTPLSKALLVRQLFCSPVSLSAMGMALALPMAAQVQAQEFEFNIPAQSLASALQELGRQGNIQVLYNPERVKGLQGGAVKGKLTPGQAASELLKNSGVNYSMQGDTLTLSNAPATGASSGVNLAATTIGGQMLGTSTDGTGSYTTGAVTIGKTPHTLREIPQSVTVVTRQQMDDKNLTKLDEVMAQTTGITRSNRNFGGNVFNSRGFTLEDDSYLIDGVPGLAYNLTGWMRPDMAVFDRVEVIRGATGLLVGAGNPGGAVNLVRKRPTADPRFSISTSAGSWDNYRMDLDGSGRLNDQGTLRGRAVVAYEDHGYFQDGLNSQTPLLYGIVEADLNDATTLAVGLRHQRTLYQGYTIFGLPRYSNGREIDVSRSTSLGQDWNRHEIEVNEVFADLEHHLNDNWTSKVSVSQSESMFNQRVAYSQGALDPVTQDGTFLSSTQFRREYVTSKGIDGHVSGNFDAFGLTHELMLGANWSQQHILSKQSLTDIDLPIDVFNPNHNLIPKPQQPAWQSLDDITQRQYGLYSTLRLRLTEPLSLVLGGRLSWYKNDNTRDDYTVNPTKVTPNNYREDKKFTPFAGLIYDLNEQWSWYASYADIFRPQSNYRDASGKGLEPTLGSNYETGIKGALYDGRLNVSAAVFYIKQKDLFQTDDAANAVPLNNCQQYNPSSGSCYKNGPPSVSKGVELEASGEVATGWQMSAGYTYNITRNEDGSSIDSETPKHMLRVSTMYNLQGDLNRLSVGGGVSTQSGYVSHFNDQDIPNPGRAIWDARTAYKLDDHWKLSFDLKNVFDKKYYEATGELRRGSYYGEPRNFMVTLRGDF